MEGKLDPLESLLRTAIGNHLFANPLSDVFDRDKLLEFLASDLELLGDLKVDISTGKEFLHAILDLNIIYKQLMDEIIEQINKTGLSNDSLVERILAYVNFTHCNAVATTREPKDEGVRTQVKNASEAAETEFTNIFGQKGNLSDAVDLSVDVCNERLSIINDLEDTD